MSNFENTYWNHSGKYEAAAQELNKLIPCEGAVERPHKNRALEKFRKASNCYYDLYNNGLCNRARSFARVFGIASSAYRIGNWRFAMGLYTATEVAMDDIVVAAAREQGLESLLGDIEEV